MHSHHATEHDVRHVRAIWSDENSRGLEHGEAGDWSQAADAFSAAAAAISASQATQPSLGSGSHDALALVLGNLAGASFRAGRSDDAIRHAQRACALRVALVGEDAVAVARLRSDLAVMLCAVGRTEESYALLERAILGIEQHAGDEDLRLAPVLENAARVAMAMARPASAEPHLLRLHALLAAHGLPTASADLLLVMVGNARGAGADALHSSRKETADVASEAGAEPTEIGEVASDVTPYAAKSESPAAEEDDGFTLVDAEDQPLRDAVALTDILLRTTPCGVPMIAHAEERAPIELLDAELRHAAASAGAADTREALASMRARADSATIEAMPEELEVATTLARELERDPHATLPTSQLGFTVQYGFDGYEDARRTRDDAAVRDEQAADAPTVAFHPSPERAFEPSDEAAVPPLTPAAGNPADALVATDADSTSRRPLGAALRAGRATAPQSSRGVLIAAAITLAAAATAALAYLRAAA